MSYTSDYNKRKQTAIEYSKVLDREILPRDIRISKSGIISAANLSADEAETLMNYLKNKFENQGFNLVDDPVFEAECDSMLSTKH
jgi:hypothetical protein